MAVYSISIPEANSIDALAEAREQRDERTRAGMSHKSYIDAILEGVRDAMEKPGNPLAELADMLFDAPIRDSYDRQAFLEMRDVRRPGKTIMSIMAQASLDTYQDADNEGF